MKKSLVVEGLGGSERAGVATTVVVLLSPGWEHVGNEVLKLDPVGQQILHGIVVKVVTGDVDVETAAIVNRSVVLPESFTNLHRQVQIR